MRTIVSHDSPGRDAFRNVAGITWNPLRSPKDNPRFEKPQLTNFEKPPLTNNANLVLPPHHHSRRRKVGPDAESYSLPFSGGFTNAPTDAAASRSPARNPFHQSVDIIQSAPQDTAMSVPAFVGSKLCCNEP
jgi:hypothetical protein